MTIFDCHVHLPLGSAEPFVTSPILEPDKILEELHELGVIRAVCFPAFAVEPDNRALSEFAAAREDVVPFAWLNPHLPHEERKLRRLITEHEFRGVKLHPLLHGFSPESMVVDPLVAATVELAVPVLVHSGHPMFATPWQVAGLASRWPEAIVIMEHMGLQLGWVDAAIKLAESHDHLILGVTGMPFFRKIREAVETIGAARVIWGSEAPALDPATELLRVRRCGLTHEDEGMVLGGALDHLLAQGTA